MKWRHSTKHDELFSWPCVLRPRTSWIYYSVKSDTLDTCLHVTGPLAGKALPMKASQNTHCRGDNEKATTIRTNSKESSDYNQMGWRMAWPYEQLKTLIPSFCPLNAWIKAERACSSHRINRCTQPWWLLHCPFCAEYVLLFSELENFLSLKPKEHMQKSKCFWWTWIVRMMWWQDSR